ncbi:hypothetical protein V500_04903 [Pseudogymnoascus sp. VKM F-4518 (FW-2643)]|nr:hypothetical protein V500_04903 [Pseudogymnoascus sp. VKM F-4518 (FW-2643)]
MLPEFRTWRVRNIPLLFDGQQLSDALHNHTKLWIPTNRVPGARNLGLDEHSREVIVKTLSTDIQSTHQVATVRFGHLLPPLLLDSCGPWRIEVSTTSATLPASSKRQRESYQIIIDDDFDDLTVLSSPPYNDHEVDIIAISGLGSHGYGSYVSKQDGNMWLSDSLTIDWSSARVMIYGYNSKLHDSKSFEDLEGLAGSFQIALSRLVPSSKNRRPLLILGHSLGGLVVKESLIRIAESDYESSLLESVVGAIFLGVPNDGMDIESLIPMVDDQPNRFLLESLNRVNSQVLRMQKRNFFKVLQKSNIELFCFYETLLSPTAAKDANGEYKMTGEQRCLVSQSSASSCLPQGASSDHAIPLSCAHSGLVKFKYGDAEYHKLLDTLRKLYTRVLRRLPPKQAYTSTLPNRRAQQVLDKVADPNLAATSALRQSYLASLAFPQIDSRLRNVRNVPSKSCRWLLSKSEYKDWLNDDKISEHHGFLWIKGKPATGKSTIMKFAFTNAMKTTKDTIVISFFFNARGEHLEKSVLGLYRSLLVQLLEKFPELLYLLDSLPSRSRDNDGYSQLDIEIVKRLFSHAVENLGRRSLTCFIDALDECEEDQVRDTVKFFENIGELVVSTQIRFRVCFSSRYYPHITIDKSVQLTLEGQEGHRQDIVNYLQSDLKIGLSKQAEDIKGEILERASGIFLWVVLVVDMLQKEYDRGRIYSLRKRLDGIPNGLDDLFSDILTRDRQNMEELILCLQWILYAKRPLKREELYFAILAGVEPDALTAWDSEQVTRQDMERFVLSSSKGLADVTKSKDQTVQFIHESVRDFLLEGNKLDMLRSDLSSNFPGQSHEILKQCCEFYMRTDTSEHLSFSTPPPAASSDEAMIDRRITAQRFPFLEYSVRNVLHHADAASGYGISQDAFVKNFVLTAWINYSNLFENYQVRRYTPNASLLYILAEQNLSNLIRIELKQVPHMDIEGERYGFPMFAALAHKNEGAVRALLMPNISSSRSKDHHETVRWILENSSDINPRKRQTLLSRVAERGQEAAVKLLLETGQVKVDSTNSIGETALSLAAERGHEAIVKLLLDISQVEVDLKNDYGKTPLSLAAEKGHTTIVQLLLDTSQVKVNIKDDYGLTPLLLAARGGHEPVLKLLLKTGQVKVDLTNSISETALSLAAERGHEAVVKLLLNTSQIEVDLKNGYGQTPLSLAAEEGHDAIVQLLLDISQVGVNIKDNYGLTPLSLAARRGHEAVVKLLLETGQVEVDLKDADGLTLLSRTAWRGHEAIVKLLLETGQVEVNLKDANGLTPLSLAAEEGHEAVVQLLLNTSQVKVDIKDDYGLTPLSLAARRGHEAIVKLLLETGQVDVNSKSIIGDTALSLAAIGGHNAVVKLLLEIGQADVDLKNAFNETPLLLAARWGHNAVVKLLLETAQVEVSSTPLSLADRDFDSDDDAGNKTSIAETATKTEAPDLAL